MKKVLVIEDDQKIAKSLEIRLRSVGVRPILAYDAVMGVQSFNAYNPDLIIMDVMMPAGNGIDTAINIQDMSDSDIPIIFITASKKISVQDKALALGAAGFFEKPYDSERLLNKVISLL